MSRSSRHWLLFMTTALSLFAAGCETFDPGNPLIGRWTLTTPAGVGFALGTYEFRRSSMEALGLEQQVDYSVSGDTVLVVPQGFGPTLEVEMIDRNTARLNDPITGGLLMLRRIR
jgi:hypothetical protein